MRIKSKLKEFRTVVNRAEIRILFALLCLNFSLFSTISLVHCFPYLFVFRFPADNGTIAPAHKRFSTDGAGHNNTFRFFFLFRRCALIFRGDIFRHLSGQGIPANIKHGMHIRCKYHFLGSGIDLQPYPEIRHLRYVGRYLHEECEYRCFSQGS